MWICSCHLKDPPLYLDDMPGFCTKVLEYTKHLDADNFSQSGVIYDATRNRLIHGYLGIDNDVLWSIVQTDIPQLLHQLQRIKSQWARQA